MIKKIRPCKEERSKIFNEMSGYYKSKNFENKDYLKRIFQLNKWYRIIASLVQWLNNSIWKFCQRVNNLIAILNILRLWLVNVSIWYQQCCWLANIIIYKILKINFCQTNYI